MTIIAANGAYADSLGVSWIVSAADAGAAGSMRCNLFMGGITIWAIRRANF